MDEDIIRILEYLPIRVSKNELDYRMHLWNSFVKLYQEVEDNKEQSTQSFSIMPFHILFMLILQYKVMRIKMQRSNLYEERIKRWQDEKKQVILLNVSSVYELGLMSETSLVGMLNIIGLSEDCIDRIKNLVTHRNDNVAHAKGGYIFDVDEKLNDYLDCLSEVQGCMKELNNEIAENWLKEIEDNDSLEDFKEIKLASSYICREDFNSGHMQVLEGNSTVAFSEWLDSHETTDEPYNFS